MICEKCGKDVQGILQWAEHPCNIQTITYSGAMSDNEMRIAFMEHGMPRMGFEMFDLAPPTEMEKIIYRKGNTEPGT